MNNLVFPMEKTVNVYLHQVLIVDWEPHNKRLRVTNLGTTDKEGWVSEETFFNSTKVKYDYYGSYKLFEII